MSNLNLYSLFLKLPNHRTLGRETYLLENMDLKQPHSRD